MVAPEVQHLLRVTKPTAQVARDFANYCRKSGVVTTGLKVAQTSRGIRGLVAVKPIANGATVARVPLRASISAFTAVHDADFLSLIDPDAAALPFRKDYLAEVVGKPPLRFDQLLLGLYMTHASLEADHPRRPYLDFMPRHEGYFAPLHDKLNLALDEAWVVLACEQRIAKRHSVAASEVRQLLLFSLSMIFSRQILLSDATAITSLFREAAMPLPSSPFSTSVLYPIADLVNHSKTVENVDFVVDTAAPHDLSMIATTDIEVGGELSLMYSDNLDQLRMMWGIPTAV
jgi:hypothetical protein